MTVIEVPLTAEDARFMASFKRNDPSALKRAATIIDAALCKASLAHPGKLLTVRFNWGDSLSVGVYASATPQVLYSRRYVKDGRVINVRESARERAETYLSSRCE